MPKVTIKRRGETPLEAITKFKKTHPQLSNTVISYAGRLDPMAEGLVLLLIGDENKKRHEFEGCEKTYEFDVLFGMTSDTYDLLGLVQNPGIIPENLHELVSQYVLSHSGKITQFYPPFSSKPVNGKPLYYWARKNLLKDIAIPSKEVTISEFQLLSQSTLPSSALGDIVDTSIASVTGDFRQEKISEQWKEFFKENRHTSFPLFTFQITCSSGTYVRGIAHDIGQIIGCGAIASRIKRTRIGPYSLTDVPTSSQ